MRADTDIDADFRPGRTGRVLRVARLDFEKITFVRDLLHNLAYVVGLRRVFRHKGVERGLNA